MGKFEKKSTKKPITKKWWFWVIVVLIAMGMGSQSRSKEPVKATTTPQATVETKSPAPSKEQETEPDTTSAIPFQVDFDSSFINDKTGRWRQAVVTTSEKIDKYAVDYYKEYFKSDDEVHYIYNFTLKTVNALTVQAGTLFVTVTEYTKGEEHDAAKAGGGLYYGQYHFDLSTGEMTYSTFE